MANSSTSSQIMNAELCRAWVEDKVFPLQPETYQNNYPGFPGMVGIEVEMLPIRNIISNGPPQRVQLQGVDHSLASWLRKIAIHHGWITSESSSAEDSMLMGIKLDQDDNLSFEPGGQLEFSSRPYHCLSEVINRTTYIQALLDKELLELGDVTLTQIGFNPWHGVEYIGLQMRKPRYRAMNEFFSAISEYGPRMMRQTCTVQVNLDFGRDEETMAKRFLASMLIAPVSGAIFNYSAFEHGKFTGMTGLRQRVWRHLDPSRTDIPNLQYLTKSLNKKACVDTWLEFLMKSRVVFVTKQDYMVMHKPVTWAEWMSQGINGKKPDAEDFETHLSLLFPEVRARGFLELRSVDCQSRVWQFAPAGWWTGLLYNDKALNQVLDLMMPRIKDLNSLLLRADQGLNDPVLAGLAKKLATIALDGLQGLPTCYFGGGALKTLSAFSEQFINRGRVPSDDLIDEYKKRDILDFQCIKNVEMMWSEKLVKCEDPALTVCRRKNT